MMSSVISSLSLPIVIVGVLTISCGTVVGNGNKSERDKDPVNDQRAESGEMGSDAMRVPQNKSSDGNQPKRGDDIASDVATGPGGVSNSVEEGERESLAVLLSLIFTKNCPSPFSYLNLPVVDDQKFSMVNYSSKVDFILTVSKDLDYIKASLWKDFNTYKNQSSSEISHYIWATDLDNRQDKEKINQSAFESGRVYACSSAKTIKTEGVSESLRMTIKDSEAEQSYFVDWIVDRSDETNPVVKEIYISSVLTGMSFLELRLIDKP